MLKMDFSKEKAKLIKAVKDYKNMPKQLKGSLLVVMKKLNLKALYIKWLQDKSDNFGYDVVFEIIHRLVKLDFFDREDIEYYVKDIILPIYE